jgi:phosphoribosylformylglycinamidine (FGAM) synthase-like enzyme
MTAGAVTVKENYPLRVSTSRSHGAYVVIAGLRGGADGLGPVDSSSTAATYQPQ